MHRIIVALFVLLWLAPSAALAQFGPVTLPPKGSSACLMVAVGHKLQVRKIGITVFGNSSDDIAVNWGLDEMVAGRISATLGKHFTVRRVPYPKTHLAAFENPNRAMFDRTDNVQDAVRAAAASSKCTVYVSAQRGSAQVANTNQRLTGLGVLRYGNDLINRVMIYGVFTVSMFDGKTFERMKTTAASNGKAFLEEAFLGEGIHGAYRRVEKEMWRDPPQTFAQDAKVREAIRSLAAQGAGHAAAALIAQ